MAMQIWLIIFVILLGIEIGTMALTTIWFAIGAIAGLIAALLGASTVVQIVVFLTVSFVVLIFYRPLAIKHVNTKLIKTNVDELVGKEGRVTEKVDNLSQTGRMVVGGMDWSARTERDDVIVEVGTVVKVVKVVGAKLLVEPLK